MEKAKVANDHEEAEATNQTKEVEPLILINHKEINKTLKIKLIDNKGIE